MLSCSTTLITYLGVIAIKSLNVRKSLIARKSLNTRKSLLSPGAMVSPEKVLRNKIMIISLMKPKTLLNIMLTMIPLMMMTMPNRNRDFHAFSCNNSQIKS